ncbi:uncharacterized protein LOC108263779 [Ictalurus punctatus]|uniref:Uncharacterized protein LOC108263779 n=1 Tax=Ictalurus punctatus TaxID=7998 RepID=A0A9F7RIH2_ICTPU|nr:uncharacterized protein LOC108263779 [Ictalurus punctatus]
MDYYFQDGTTKTPAAFQNELTPVSGSAVVQTRMIFNSSSPVPSESLVLSAIQTLLSARLTNLSDSVKVLNFTYEKISDTSYAVNFTLSISNISMSKNPDFRNDTYTQVENINNNVLNTLLNEPGAEPFESQSSFFTSSGNQENGDMDYYFQDGDTKTPAAFLNELKPVLGNVLIRIRLVFKNLTRVPSEADLLNAANALLDSKIRRRRSLVIQTLSDPVSIQDVIYEKIGNNSYIISFAFQITNVTISKDLQLRNGTYDLIQNTINSLLNTILNVKDAPAFVFPQANYTFNGTAIEANFEYIFVEGETKWTPSGFLSAILNISELSTFTTPAAQTESTVHVVLRPTTLVVVQTRMLFNSSCPVPSESLVLRAIQTLLSAQLTNLTDSVNRLNFTYEKISETSYAVFFTLSISNISMSKNAELRNDTYTQVENIINNALNTLLNDAGAAPFEPQSSFFT